MNYKVINADSLSPEEIFEILYKENTSCLLQSASIHPRTARYSIIATEPDSVFRSWGNIIRKNDDPEYKGNPLEELRRIFKEKHVNAKSDVPMLSGGAIGYIGYDAVRLWQEVGNNAEKDINIPDIYLLFYSKLVVYDHLFSKLYVVGDIDLNKRKEVFAKQERVDNAKISPSLSKEAFEDIVLKAKEYIAEGDIYQANLSQRIEIETNADGWSLYKKLKEINPSPFAGFMDFSGMKIISCSPERLVKVQDGYIETRPIAGTSPREIEKEADLKSQKTLISHPKECAEHIMLVDLERNDLGRVSEYGSVKVDEFMAIESYSHVHHIVSNVCGKLDGKKDFIDILKAVFPGGTITGCPKVRCMQIIDELEPVRRNIYTGSMGYLGFNGSMDLNILIRTMLQVDNRLFIQVGAGIVADSVPEKEYNETLYKAGALIEAVKSMNNYKVESKKDLE